MLDFAVLLLSIIAVGIGVIVFAVISLIPILSLTLITFAIISGVISEYFPKAFLRPFETINEKLPGINSFWFGSVIFGTMTALVWWAWPILVIVGLAVLMIGVLTLTAVVTEKSIAEPKIEAPKGFLIDCLLPPDQAEEIVVNILARYPYWMQKHGLRKARFIFGLQSIGSILYWWASKLVRRSKLILLLLRS